VVAGNGVVLYIIERKTGIIARKHVAEVSHGDDA
jgi:hypothetical protein